MSAPAAPASSPPVAAMMGWALRWVDHGGGPADEIGDRFHLTPQQYFTTLLTALDHSPPAPIHPAVAVKLRQVARTRLWLLT